MGIEKKYSDKQIVYEMGTSSRYIIMSAYEYGTVHDFGERAGIINSMNYMTVIKRLRKALKSLYYEGRCEKIKIGRGYSYNFTKSVGESFFKHRDELFIEMYNRMGCAYFSKGSDEELKEWGNSEAEIRQIKIESVVHHLRFYKDGIETYKAINELCGGQNNFNLEL